MEFSELAAEEFRKLDKPVRERVAHKLHQIAVDPGRFVSRLRSVEAFRLRVGDYRVILDIDWERNTLYVLSVGHRSTVYR